MNKYIQAIIESGKPVYFVSPHLDDAIFSCGALMKTLSEHMTINVINVFTTANADMHTMSAKAFLKQCNYTDSKMLFSDRKQEDRDVMAHLNANVTNLDFVDALWRRRKDTNPLSATLSKVLPEFAHVYPTYRFHMMKGSIAQADSGTLDTLVQKLGELIPEDAIVFSPAAIGNHVDHVMVRRACEAAFKNFIYWTDFPYTTRTGLTVESVVPKGTQFKCSTHLDTKLDLMYGYHTQVFAIKEFRKKNLVMDPEHYVIKG